MMGERQFGRMWRTMTRRSGMPRLMQLCTNSRPRSARNSPRTWWATAGQFTMAMASTMLFTDGARMATRTMAKRNVGIVWKNSVVRMRRSSIQPPGVSRRGR